MASVSVGAGGMIHLASVGVGAVQAEWNGPYSNSGCGCRLVGPVELII